MALDETTGFIIDVDDARELGRPEAKPFPLTTLPKELRLEVYSHMMRLIYRPIFSHIHSLRGFGRWYGYAAPTSVLQASRQVNAEIRAVLRWLNDGSPPVVICSQNQEAFYSSLLFSLTIARRRDVHWLQTNGSCPDGLGVQPAASTVSDPVRFIIGALERSGVGDSSFLRLSPEMARNVYNFVEQTLIRLRRSPNLELVLLAGHPRHSSSPETTTREICKLLQSLGRRGKSEATIKTRVSVLGALRGPCQDDAHFRHNWIQEPDRNAIPWEIASKDQMKLFR
ncbi:hypothetical protein BU26DRAFT_512411 [Trematosphaeria pertusa]|uniref:Uncharacterized protein n=1 Tax=Trematosphaeria pertusa TaxID=390896 RepID=A0A6A6HQS8_9PLEO|nr:uncharacterized protein BU26DRAFT_512411 [Trematosphaeria pertusa]KAF2240229.1 hypothetical protein BU26DRAFT_512411 [Trematosphaeria pertusa]